MCFNIHKCVYTELEKAREEEKQTKSFILSFEKQIQSERTLKIQVCLACLNQDFITTAYMYMLLCCSHSLK